MLRPSILDYGLLLSVGLMWGAQFALNDIAIASFGPLTVGAGRLVFGVLALSLILALTADAEARPGPPPRQPWRLYALIALVEGVVPLVFIPWGQRTVDSAIAAILLAMVPIFTLLLAPAFVAAERWTRTAVASVAVGFAGVVVLLAPSVEANVLASLGGELVILVATACWALGIILMRRVPRISPFRAMRNIFALAALPTVPLALIVERPWVGPVSAESVAALLALGLVCGGLAYGLFLYAVMRNGPTFAALVGYLVTLFGVLIGVVLMGDPFGLNDVAAIALIAAALALARGPARPAPVSG